MHVVYQGHWRKCCKIDREKSTKQNQSECVILRGFCPAQDGPDQGGRHLSSTRQDSTLTAGVIQLSIFPTFLLPLTVVQCSFAPLWNYRPAIAVPLPGFFSAPLSYFRKQLLTCSAIVLLQSDVHLPHYHTTANICPLFPAILLPLKAVHPPRNRTTATSCTYIFPAVA